MAESSMNWTPVALVALGYFILKDMWPDDDEEAEEGKKATKTITKLDPKKNPFSYSTFVLPPKRNDAYRLTLDPREIVKAAAKIDDGIGIAYDDEAQIMAGVKMAGTKTDIAVIAKFMNSKYNYDVYEKFKKNLSKKERGRINSYVLKLPNYKSTGYRL